MFQNRLKNWTIFVKITILVVFGSEFSTYFTADEKASHDFCRPLFLCFDDFLDGCSLLWIYNRLFIPRILSCYKWGQFRSKGSNVDRQKLTRILSKIRSLVSLSCLTLYKEFCLSPYFNMGLNMGLSSFGSLQFLEKTGGLIN